MPATITKDGICAWCKRTYDRATGERIGQLSDAEYHSIPNRSDGICKLCSINLYTIDTEARVL